MSENNSIESYLKSMGVKTTSSDVEGKKRRGRPPKAPGERLTDKRKQSLYLPEEVVDQIKATSERLDRSFSWVVQKAWKIARAEMEAATDMSGEPDTDDDTSDTIG